MTHYVVVGVRDDPLDPRRCKSKYVADTPEGALDLARHDGIVAPYIPCQDSELQNISNSELEARSV